MAERTLIVLRHAKSDWSGEQDDIARPLNARGRRQAPEAGRWLNDNVPPLDLAIVSTAARAQETWRLVAAELDSPPPVHSDDRVYANSVTDLLAVVREAPETAETVVLVAHNPGVEGLVAKLTGESIEIPTSAIAVMAVAGAWADVSDGSAELRSSGRPPTA